MTRTSILKAIKKHKDAIGKHRDALREILEDLESVVDSCDDAHRELESALETLSQYL